MKSRNIISRKFAYILHQIFNEWRSNWALLAELLIVSSVVWYIVDCTYVLVVRAMEPTGFDITNCYRIEVSEMEEGALGYDPAHSDSDETKIADRLALIDRLRHDEDIEAAAYSWRNDPFQGAYMGNMLKCDTLEAQVRSIVCQPDFIKVFRYQGTDGKTPEQLAALLKDRNILVSDGVYGKDFDMSRLAGKPLILHLEDSVPWRYAGAIVPVKRFTWEEASTANVALMPMTYRQMTGGGMGMSLAIRVKDSRTQGFADRFREKIKGQKMRVGNLYISDFTSYEDLKKDSETSVNTQMNYYIVGIIFLMLNVFLGLLGTFWFRTQHRFPEIGLQKVIGATNTDITLRLFAEAMLLMTIAFIPSLLIDFNIAHAELTMYYCGTTLSVPRFIVCALISYALMMLIICLGIWFPAVKAIKANPVEVLRGE